MKPSLIPVLIAALSAPAFAQLNDIPPVDLKQVLAGLKQFKEQNETGLKTRRDAAYRQIVAAAASNESAAAYWTNAVLAVQFVGVDHQTAAVRDWKQGDGEALKTKECANAVRLHLVWLGLTMQHAAGAETAKLLPSIIDYTRQLEADDLAIGKFAEQIEKAKAANTAKRPATNKSIAEDTHAKRLHDSILRTPVASSVIAQNLQIADLLGDAGRRRKKNDDDTRPSGWESIPGNVNGIYNAILLPEFRDTKDPRLMDYWDMMLRKNQESIFAGMPSFDERQKTQVERPIMLWNRAQDMYLIGLRNRAITEMYNLIKSYPQHTEAANWIKQLEGIIAPAPSATILNSGAVAPPAAIPSATGNPPTATIVPAAPSGVR
jgi:hypothetical protein